MSNLTSEQLKLIEENRKRALELKSKKNTPTPPQTSIFTNLCSSTSNGSKISSPAISPTLSLSAYTNLPDGGVLSCVLISKDRFLVTCKYDPKLVTLFKSVTSRRYDPGTKGWSFSISDYQNLVKKVKDTGRELSELENAVLVKDKSGAAAAVELNNDDFKKRDSIYAKCYIISRSRFEVDIPYNAACIGIFKAIPSKVYDVNTRKWSFALSDYNSLYTRLRKLSNVCIDPLSSTVLTVFKHEISGKGNNMQETYFDESKLNETLLSSLMPFQREGVAIAVSREGRILFADDMGLGKTVQSICIALYFKESWPLLVICPSSVRLMWKESLLRWLDSYLCEDDINVVLSGRDVTSHSVPVEIISYDLLKKHDKNYEKKKFRIAIVDESHFIKNYKTARSRSVAAVVKHCKQLLLLSGTPALSRPVELYTQISLLRPDLFSNFHQFGLRYCAAKKNQWAWEYTGSSNMTELGLVLEEAVMIRRTKKDVLSQLPPKLRRSVTIDITDIKTTSKQREAFENAHLAIEKKGLTGVEKHGALLQFFNETAYIKLPAIKSYVFDLLEGGHKFLVFAHHKIVLNSLEQDLNKKGFEYMRVDGNTPSERRQSEVAKFQEKNSCKVALLSITAANMGITLHAASLVVFAELFWNPGILVQAEDRCYRIGQRDVVNVHYLVAKGTSDDYIWQMVKKKLDVLGKAGLSGNSFDDTESHDAPKPDVGQRNILQYFKTMPTSKTSADVDQSSCNIPTSDEELLLALEKDNDFFDDVWISTDNINMKSSNIKCTDQKGDGSQQQASSLVSNERKRDSFEFDEEKDLDDVVNWKRKKKNISSLYQRNPAC